jgi:hypothetical protein
MWHSFVKGQRFWRLASLVASIPRPTFSFYDFKCSNASGEVVSGSSDWISLYRKARTLRTSAGKW